MPLSINPALWGQVFAIPAEITDRHIKLCSGVGLKCLLLILRFPAEFYDAKTLAAQLGQSVSEISDALNYWLVSGVLLESGEAAPAEHRTPPPARLPYPQPQLTPSAVPPPAPPSPAVSPPALAARPQFPREEAISIVDSDATLHSLLGELQAILSKLFTSADLDVLIALYSFYALSPHYIITLVSYCVSIGRASMGYAEKVAATWLAEGIDDDGVDRHVDVLAQRRGNEGRIRTAFGINDRSLTSREREYIATWFDSYHFDLPLIEYAYEITVERTGKLAFGYLNKILSSWHQNGIGTLEEAKRESKPASAVPSVGTKNSNPDNGLGRKILEQFMKD